MMLSVVSLFLMQKDDYVAARESEFSKKRSFACVQEWRNGLKPRIDSRLKMVMKVFTEKESEERVCDVFVVILQIVKNERGKEDEDEDDRRRGKGDEACSDSLERMKQLPDSNVVFKHGIGY
ncbi:unnamed protein product [Vicia faba]|uniref:Uncharacterized protein n=1 Tax=Vicia faba TaxID=3906 RepID=A0AAV0Z5X0_VICFA|nr:unnamed protein product [Vicia faba]